MGRHYCNALREQLSTKRLNRANGRLRIFDDEADYAAFEKVLTQAVDRTGTRLLAWCLMPNHFHLLLWPNRDGELSQFMRRDAHPYPALARHRHDTGSGHLYRDAELSSPGRILQSYDGRPVHPNLFARWRAVKRAETGAGAACGSERMAQPAIGIAL